MAFDVASFLNTVYEAPFQTKRALVPEGEYSAYIKSFEIAIGKRPGTLSCRFTILIDDKELCIEQNRDEVTMQPMIFLDVDPDDMSVLLYGTNQNVQLGRIRAALGQNDPTQAWNFGMLEGAGPIMIKVTHKAGKDAQTGEATGEIFDQVASWNPMP